MRPKKSLGQNFLTNTNVAKRIVNALEINDGELVVEIGPGTGSLTGYLLQQNIKLIAVEIDSRAVELVKEKYYYSNNLQIINDDIRNLDYNKIFLDNNNKKIKIIGNIPYYLSADIIFNIFENKDKISKAIIMMQKEVAKRIVAHPKCKDYGIVTVANALVSDSKILFDVSPGSFFPKPKVFSSVISFNIKQESIAIEEFHWVMILVKKAFNQRRKILKNSLHSLIEKEMNIDLEQFIIYANNYNFSKFDQRAEDLNPDEFVLLSKLLKEFQKINHT